MRKIISEETFSQGVLQVFCVDARDERERDVWLTAAGVRALERVGSAKRAHLLVEKGSNVVLNYRPCNCPREYPCKVVATWADGDKREGEFVNLLAAQRWAARMSRSKERGGPSCCAVVYEGGQVCATWHDGKQTRAKKVRG